VRPKVILNCAASADGKIALSNRQRLELSNNEDFERVHLLRSKYDAILVGIGTIIEDNVFIGSGGELVAPVAVKEGATIGAGSTITKHTPKNKLTLERARQKTIPNWKRPKKKTT